MRGSTRYASADETNFREEQKMSKMIKIHLLQAELFLQQKEALPKGAWIALGAYWARRHDGESAPEIWGVSGDDIARNIEKRLVGAK